MTNPSSHTHKLSPSCLMAWSQVLRFSAFDRESVAPIMVVSFPGCACRPNYLDLSLKLFGLFHYNPTTNDAIYYQLTFFRCKYTNGNSFFLLIIYFRLVRTFVHTCVAIVVIFSSQYLAWNYQVSIFGVRWVVGFSFCVCVVL